MNGFNQIFMMNLFNEFLKKMNFNHISLNQNNNFNNLDMNNNINCMNMINNFNNMDMNNNINCMNMSNNLNGGNMNNNINFMNMSNNLNGGNMNNNINFMNMSNNLNGGNMNNNINCMNMNNNINNIFRRNNVNCMKLNRNINGINLNKINNLERANMNNHINFVNINNMNMNNNLNNMNFNNNFNRENSVNSLSNQFQNLNLHNNMNLNNNINLNNNRKFCRPVCKMSSPNINNINFNPFNNFCSNNININGISNNTQITMKFSFTCSLVFYVKARLNERLCDVIERFKKNECPKELRNDISVVLHGGEEIIDKNKTLSELNIKDGNIILFIIKHKKEKNKVYGKKDKAFKLSEDERIQVKKWLIEYKKMKFINEMANNQNNIENNKNLIILNNRESLINFMDFIRKKEREGFIKVNEHEHKLVYCLTIFDWKCNLCQKKYNKENARYYCSICNFNMCDNCHSKGEYIKKKAFPEGVKPTNKMVKKKYFETDYHEHRLVYCRSSRSVIGYNGWICDNCRDNFDNDVWSFFCTNCDFDLCCSCMGYNS